MKWYHDIDQMIYLGKEVIDWPIVVSAFLLVSCNMVMLTLLVWAGSSL